MPFTPSRKLASIVSVALVAWLGAAALGCGDGHDGDWGTPPPDQTITATPEKVGIDTGATLNTTAGQGVGVFVQESTGGHWTVTTACDTATSGDTCHFELFLRGTERSTTLSNPQGKQLEGNDTIDILSDGSLHLYAETSTGLDGLTFDATPGATVELEMYLDTVPQPRFVYWVGKDVLHAGAPTDPVDFAPSAK